METFPNYTEAMYCGDEPSYYKAGIGGKIAHYQSYYGSGDFDWNGEIVNAEVSLLDNNNTIYIVGNNIELMHIPYDGVPHYWKWTTKQSFLEHGKKCLPNYPKDYIQRLFKKKRDMDGSFLFEKVKEKFLKVFVEIEGEFY